MADNLTEIKEALKNDKLVIGTERVMKGLRAKKLAKVFLSSNVPEDVKYDIEHYAEINNTEVVVLEIPNEELGVACKKKFHISVLAIA